MYLIKAVNIISINRPCSTSYRFKVEEKLSQMIHTRQRTAHTKCPRSQILENVRELNNKEFQIL